MPEVDFVMTYPCYFLLTEAGNPEAVVIDGEQCLCLFTDSDLLEPFYKEKYRESIAPRQVRTWTMSNRLELLSTLKDFQTQLAPGVVHVAIDASPRKRTIYVRFNELIKDLEGRDD